MPSQSAERPLRQETYNRGGYPPYTGRDVVHDGKKAKVANPGNRGIEPDLASYNYRSHVLLDLLRDQAARFHCSGAVWTQTTDVESEVSELVTHDRRVRRVNVMQWREDIHALYDAAAARV